MGKGAATRDTILEFARGEVARSGFRAVSIGSLASSLGLSKSGVFAHFSSKEALEAAIIDHAAEHFTAEVVRPALKTPRGEPRVRALLEGWIRWFRDENQGRGCVFVAAAPELDDRPGLARDRLVSQQQEWLEFLASMVRTAINEGHFRTDLDPLQFAFEAHGILLGLHHAVRLLEDPRGLERAHAAIDRLIADAQAK